MSYKDILTLRVSSHVSYYNLFHMKQIIIADMNYRVLVECRISCCYYSNVETEDFRDFQ